MASFKKMVFGRKDITVSCTTYIVTLTFFFKKNKNFQNEVGRTCAKMKDK